MAVFPWVVAIDAFDFNSRESLAGLIESESIPEELRPVIAAIVRGERVPNLKAAAKMKIPAAERLEIAGALSAALELIDALKYDVLDPHGVSDECGVSVLGDQTGREPNEIMRQLEASSRLAIQMAAQQLDVSTETIENLLRALRRKMESFPIV